MAVDVAMTELGLQRFEQVFLVKKVGARIDGCESINLVVKNVLDIVIGKKLEKYVAYSQNIAVRQRGAGFDRFVLDKRAVGTVEVFN